MWGSIFGSKQPSWTVVARQAKLIRPEIIELAQKQLARLPGLKKRAEPLLDQMAATSSDAAGIIDARKRLAAALPGFADPDHQASGEDRNVATVKQCALVLFHGLLARAGAAVRSGPQADQAAVALLEAARAIDAFGDSLKADLLAELRKALGPELYNRASETLGPRPDR